MKYGYARATLATPSNRGVGAAILPASDSPGSDGRGLPNLSQRQHWIDSFSAKRTQFEGAGLEAIDKIFVRRLRA